MERIEKYDEMLRIKKSKYQFMEWFLLYFGDSSLGRFSILALYKGGRISLEMIMHASMI